MQQAEGDSRRVLLMLADRSAQVAEDAGQYEATSRTGAVIEKMMAKNRQERYPSVAALLAELPSAEP